MSVIVIARKFFLLLCCCFCGWLGIAFAVQADVPVQDPVQPRNTAQPESASDSQSVPTDGALERKRARIGQIEIFVDDIFEGNLNGALYKAANALHLSTRAQTIANQLLFHSGDIYQRRILDESERLLRSRRYLNAASIEPLAYNDDNTVDIVVRVHDVWTLSPGVSFGRKGGVNNTRFEFEDSNFLGLGKYVSLARASGAERTAWRAAYNDPNVLGTWWQTSLAYATLSDGNEKTLLVARPFMSLDARWSATLAAADSASNTSLYRLGQVAEQFEQRRRSFELGGGISDGLVNGRTTRWLAGYRYQDREFTALPEYPAAALPKDRTLSYVWVGAEWLQDRYLETHNLDQVGRTEDLYIGQMAHVELGFDSTLLGATHDGVLLNGIWQSGYRFSADQFLLGSTAVNGRFEQGELRNTQLDAAARYYWRHSSARVSYGSINVSRVYNLDGEEQLALGGDNGLRGYPLKYQAGVGRALLTAEERFYTPWQPFRLVNVGAAVFFDAGRTFGTDPVAGGSAGWLSDVGLGLRLGNARSGLGNVVHIDLAFPLNAPRDIAHMQVLIETKRSF